MKKHLLKLLLLCCIGILALSLFACVPTTEQYKLEFIVEGEVYHSRTTDGHSRINPPTDPTKEGYSFAGWYFDEEYNVEYHSYSLEKDPITADTKVYAKWERSNSHTCKAGSWIVKKQATCKEEGVQHKYCVVDYCKKILETEVIPVSETHAKPYTVEKDVIPATCKNEGSYISATYCSLCNRLISEKTNKIEIDKNAHNYVNGVLTKVGNGFKFEAECSICDDGKVSLANVEVREEIVVEPTCDTAGWVRYVYSSFGGAVSEEEPVAALGHTVAGVAIENTKIYSEITHKEVLEKVDLYVNNKSCGEVVDGIFKCEICDEYCEIKVNKPHVGEWSIKEQPSCHLSGSEMLDTCLACDARWTVRAVAPTGEHQDGELALRKVDSRFDLVVPCVNVSTGCDHATVILENVPVTKEEIIGTTCQTPDIIRYTFIDGNTYAKLDVVTRFGHFLNGVRASTLADAAGWFDYSLVTPADVSGGIKLFSDRVLACDEMHTGYYICTCCSEMVPVQIYRSHSGSWVTSTPATCTSEGVSNFYCDYCDYGDDGLVTKPISKEPHGYSWKLEIVKNGNESIAPFALVGTCTCGASVSRDNVLVTTNVSKQPTCEEEGEIIYAHTYEGKEYYVTEKIPKVDHSINGVIVNTTGKFDYAEYVLSGKISVKPGATVVCDSATGNDGYFTCSKCAEVVAVKIFRTHSGEIVESITSETSCIKTGTRHLDCIYDGCAGTEPVSFTEINHTYNVKVSSTGAGYTVEGICSASACDFAAVYEDVAHVDVKVITTPTCLNPGVIEYKFAHSGSSYTYVAKTDKGNHTFHGVDFTTLLDADGKMPSDLEGIRFIIDGTAAFKCEVCNQLVEVVLKSDEE